MLDPRGWSAPAPRSFVEAGAGTAARNLQADPGSGSWLHVDDSSSFGALPDMYGVYVVRAGGREPP